MIKKLWSVILVNKMKIVAWPNLERVLKNLALKFWIKKIYSWKKKIENFLILIWGKWKKVNKIY